MRALRASITAQVIVWSLPENAVDLTANGDLFNRPPVGLGVAEGLANVDPLGLFNKLAVIHRASLCMGSASAFRTLSPSQVIGRQLREWPMHPADDRERRNLIHVIICVGKAIAVNLSRITAKLCRTLCEARPQGFKTAARTATTTQVAVWRL